MRWVPAREQVAEALIGTARHGDLVLTLGAGDIHRTADELLALLKAGLPLRLVQ